MFRFVQKERHYQAILGPFLGENDQTTGIDCVGLELETLKIFEIGRDAIRIR